MSNAAELLVTMKRGDLIEIVRAAVEEALASRPDRREPELLTCAELGKRIRRHPGRVPEWVRKNNIPHVKLTPKEMRFDWNEVVARLKELGEEVAEDGNE